MDRRDFLGVSATAAAGMLVPATASAASAASTPSGPSAAPQPVIRSGASSITRAPVAGMIGAIGAGNPITAATGARILAKGGNAVDAAIAAAFMAYVVEPASAGIGGHGRLTVHMAKTGRTVGIDHYIRAPRGATSQAIQAALICARFPQSHGAPVHWGDPAALGIPDIHRPDEGDPVDIRPGEVPVFWACGVTPQAAATHAKLPWMATHSPGHMFVTDMRETG